MINQTAHKLVTAVLLALLAAVVLGKVARAEETICNGALGAITVDNLRVPSNGACTLNGTQVQGTLLVERNATLDAAGINVVGNIQAEGAAAVNVSGNARVGGSIQHKQGGASAIRNVQINGDLQFESNTGALAATNNRTGGSIQVFQNRGGVNITGNVVDGNLQCKENNPPPTGGNNTVQGNQEDQCANLIETPPPTPVTPTPVTPTPVTPTPAPTQPPGSDDEVCTGAIGAETRENLKVPSNAHCSLSGTVVQGNIVVERNGRLDAAAVRVDGNIQAEGAAAVNVTGNARVGGSIQVKQGGAATVRNVAVTGDIQLESNRGALVVANNRTGGNIQVFQNSGGADIANNYVDGNLQCKANNPAPTGGNNTVQGNAEDQCANLNPPLPPVGSSGDHTCTAALGAVTVDNLTVPANATCTLNGTVVQGRIVVEQGAGLDATGISVVGNLQAVGAQAVNIRGDDEADDLAASAVHSARVGGSIIIRQSGAATLVGVTVSGDITLEANSGVLEAAGNQTNGNFNIARNTGAVRIRSNTIAGDLLCQANSTAPAGGGNAVAGRQADQCAQLVGQQVFLPAVRR